MLKLGVWRPDQFFSRSPSGWGRLLYYRLSRSRVSLDLLPVTSSLGPADIDLFERLMPHVRLSNGVYRTTYRGRFRELDPVVNRILTAELGGVPEPLVEDWAASACYTSLEWFESLVPLFPRLRFIASDLFLFVIAVRGPGKREWWVVEESGSPLQYARPPFVVRLDPPEPWWLPVNAVVGKWATRRWNELRGRWDPPRWWLDPHEEQTIQWNGFDVQKLPLIHPGARRMARDDARFAVRRHSIFESAPARCHAIRTMNILNKAYFSEDQLRQGARAVADSLEPGGIWILGRTVQDDPPVHEVSIFRKEPGGAFSLIHRVGPGSEAEAAALTRNGDPPAGLS